MRICAYTVEILFFTAFQAVLLFSGRHNMKAYDVLLIDDEKPFTDTVKAELEKAGIGAATANCKGEVFYCLEKKHQDGENFYLIVMDMHCKFITHDELKSVINSLDGVMPHILFATGADKMLQKNIGGEDFKPKLLLERMLKALLNHPSMAEKIKNRCC
jgi:CheY-like chemotaxis protein